jgi:hypothetical protein
MPFRATPAMLLSSLLAFPFAAFAQDDLHIDPPDCLIVPAGAVYTTGYETAPEYSYRYEFFYDVPDMADAVKQMIDQLETKGLKENEDYSRWMGDGWSLNYPCGDFSAIIYTQDDQSAPGSLRIILAVPGG